MKLLARYKAGPTTTSMMPLVRSSSWPWRPYCTHQPKTLSFRGGSDTDNVFRTVNSAFIETSSSLPPEDDTEEGGYVDGYNNKDDDDSIETVIRGARSESRIFFEPAGETSSVIEAGSVPDGVAMCVVDSRDPYSDFRTSMEEMVEAHSIRDDWDSLEELLHCYLRVNDRTNHGYILRAFIDLLLSSGSRRRTTGVSEHRCNWGDNGSSSCGGGHNINAINNNNNNPSTSSSPCSPLSFYTSSSSGCSSTDSLSTTLGCVSIGTEENSCSSGTIKKKEGLVVGMTKKVPGHDITEEIDDSSSSSSL